MKKFFIWATAATLIAGAAFAGPSTNTRFAIQPNATFATGAPATTNNDDSCDITVSPAATLLLPYFEVNYAATSTEALNTIFTLTNTTDQPQIAHVTVWTDWSFPVLDFNIFLTGYDVQGVSLYDILGRGVIPPTSNTSPRGARSLSNTTGNPNFLASAASQCSNLPGPIPQNLLDAVRSALTTGVYEVAGTDIGCTTAGGNPILVGGTHTNAVGYITVDVAATCSQTLPTEPDYYLGEILFDNALIGDYQRINPSSATGNYAGGESMVHIKAIPEGGAAGSVVATNLPYTFYDRYTPDLAAPIGGKVDRRQPLPGVFAARYIQGGTGQFNTRLAIWREGITSGAQTAACAVAVNGFLPFEEIVRFDESENPTTNLQQGCQISPCPGPSVSTTPETGSYSVDDPNVFPLDFTGTNDLGGWMYMNMNLGEAPTAPFDVAYEDPRLLGGSHEGVSQNWVTVQMSAEGRYAVDFDAAYMGNGCSPNPGTTILGRSAAPHVVGAPVAATDPHIEPLQNVTPVAFP